MEFDLDKLSIRELRELRNKLDKAISTFDERRKREALTAVENVAREYGYSISDLASTKPSRGKVAAKYVDPANPEATWTGRGRKPRWVVDALASGKTMSDLEI